MVPRKYCTVHARQMNAQWNAPKSAASFVPAVFIDGLTLTSHTLLNAGLLTPKLPRSTQGVLTEDVRCQPQVLRFLIVQDKGQVLREQQRRFPRPRRRTPPPVISGSDRCSCEHTNTAEGRVIAG